MANNREKVYQVSFRPLIKKKLECDSYYNEIKPIDVIRDIVEKHYKDKNPFGWNDWIGEIKTK